MRIFHNMKILGNAHSIGSLTMQCGLLMLLCVFGQLDQAACEFWRMKYAIRSSCITHAVPKFFPGTKVISPMVVAFIHPYSPQPISAKARLDYLD